MSFYAADVGEVIIKPEYRKDLGHLFRGEYGRIESLPLVGFVKDYLISDSEPLCWKHIEDGHPTSYDKLSGVFRYGVTYSKNNKKCIDELLYHILPEIAEEIVFMDNIPSGDMFSDSGKIIIMPEYREEFEHFFYVEYGLLQTELLGSFAERYFLNYDLAALRYWKHGDEKDGWRGKYQTSYDEKTGQFVYGASYNRRGHYAMTEFFNEILPRITQTVVSKDGWVEPM